eukprot:gene14065-20009_t
MTGSGLELKGKHDGLWPGAARPVHVSMTGSGLELKGQFMKTTFPAQRTEILSSADLGRSRSFWNTMLATPPSAPPELSPKSKSQRGSKSNSSGQVELESFYSPTLQPSCLSITGNMDRDGGAGGAGGSRSPNRSVRVPGAPRVPHSLIIPSPKSNPLTLALLFLGAPSVKGLDDLKAKRLFLSDLPHFDMGSDLLVIAEQTKLVGVTKGRDAPDDEDDNEVKTPAVMALNMVTIKDAVTLLEAILHAGADMHQPVTIKDAVNLQEAILHAGADMHKPMNLEKRMDEMNNGEEDVNAALMCLLTDRAAMVGPFDVSLTGSGSGLGSGSGSEGSAYAESEAMVGPLDVSLKVSGSGLGSGSGSEGSACAESEVDPTEGLQEEPSYDSVSPIPTEPSVEVLKSESSESILGPLPSVSKPESSESVVEPPTSVLNPKAKRGLAAGSGREEEELPGSARKLVLVSRQSFKDNGDDKTEASEPRRGIRTQVSTSEAPKGVKIAPGFDNEGKSEKKKKTEKKGWSAAVSAARNQKLERLSSRVQFTSSVDAAKKAVLADMMLEPSDEFTSSVDAAKKAVLADMMLEPSDEVLLVLAKVEHWQFDMFKLDEVTYGHPLSVLLVLAKVEHWQFDMFKLDEVLLVLAKVEHWQFDMFKLDEVLLVLAKVEHWQFDMFKLDEVLLVLAKVEHWQFDMFKLDEVLLVLAKVEHWQFDMFKLDEVLLVLAKVEHWQFDMFKLDEVLLVLAKVEHWQFDMFKLDEVLLVLAKVEHWQFDMFKLDEVLLVLAKVEHWQFDMFKLDEVLLVLAKVEHWQFDMFKLDEVLLVLAKVEHWQFDMFKLDEVLLVLAKVEHWQFDMFKLDEVTYGHPFSDD